MGAGGRTTVTRVAESAVACHGADVAGRIDLADASVFLIRDVEIAGGVQHHPLRIVQPGLGGRTVVAGVAPRASARHGCDGPVRGQFADALAVRHIQVPGRIDRDGGDEVAGDGGRYAGADVPAGVNLADAGAGRYIEVAVGVDRDT